MSIVVTVLVICGLVEYGLSIRCFECTSQLTYYEYDACLYGDERYLPSVICNEPSVCAVYHYQTEVPGSYSRWSVTRGCLSLRYGATCEDIFSDLRKSGSVLPGQHICSTCSEDMCNLATALVAPNHVLIYLGIFGLVTVFIFNLF